MDIDLALETAEYYQITVAEAKKRVADMQDIVQKNWNVFAKKYGIAQASINRMSAAFHVL